MTIFVFISLILALAGATYTATTAFRNALASKVEMWQDVAKETWSTYEPQMQEGERSNAKTHHNRLSWSSKAWSLAHAVPVTCFAVFIFCVAGWVIGLPFFGREPEEIATLKVNSAWLVCLQAFLVVNLLSLVAMAVGTYCIYNCFSHLNNVKLDIDKRQADGLKPKIIT